MIPNPFPSSTHPRVQGSRVDLFIRGFMAIQPNRLAFLAALLCTFASGCRKPEVKPQELLKTEAPVVTASPKASAQIPDPSALVAAQRAKAERAFQRATEAALKDIHFEYDQTEIRKEDRPVLVNLANFLRIYPATRLQIEGHCDERGTNEYNIALGNRRASATLRYLTALGIQDERFTTISYGKEKPLCALANESCWSQNRRAHFLAIH